MFDNVDHILPIIDHLHCTEVRFASLLSGRFTTMAVINPPEMELALRTSVHCVLKKKFYEDISWKSRCNSKIKV